MTSQVMAVAQAAQDALRAMTDPTPEETTVTDVTTTVDTHLSGFSEPDPDRRAELIGSVWTEDGHLIDPPLAGEGHAGIAALGEALQQHYPGHRFRRASAVDEHHGHLRFAWELVAPGGEVALSGLDVGELADDGRLRRIVGFFGPLAAAPGDEDRAVAEATR
jgi:hypothetical protein